MKKTNLEYLYSMAGNDRKLIIELIDIFIDQVNEIGIELEKANAKGNYDLVGKLAHKAKSSVAIMGMSDLSQKLVELENLANKAQDKELYPSYIEQFREECADAVEELIIHRNSIKS